MPRRSYKHTKGGQVKKEARFFWECILGARFGRWCASRAALLVAPRAKQRRNKFARILLVVCVASERTATIDMSTVINR